jgi:uncharacterized RDD family membrane protein YckC
METTTTQPNYAAADAGHVRIGFACRLLAAIVDGIILVVLTWVPKLVLTAILGPIVAAVVGIALGIAYFTLEIFKAQSVGKMIFKYRITRQDGSPAERDQLVKRFAFKQLPAVLAIVALVPMLGIVGYLSMLAAVAVLASALFTLKPEKLAYHDRLFGTAVFGPAKLSVTVPTAADLKPATAAA